MIRLACATISFDGFGDDDFVKTFDLAPKAGFKNIEFNCWYPRTLTPEKMRDLKERCRIAGLVPVALHVGGFGGTDNRSEATKEVCHKIRAMEAAKELGCRRVVATGYARGESGGIRAVIACLKEIEPIAREMDVLISLENHANNNIETVADYQEILDAVPSKNIGICIDTGHFDASGVDMDELMDKFTSQINHIHLKENKGFGKKLFTRFGEGTTDNYHVVKKMISLGYEGILTIELSPEIGESDGRPFGLDDLVKPRTMFEVFETKQ